MYVVSLFAFIWTALLGATMAVLHWRGIKSGKALGIAHGLFGVSGLVLLAVGLARIDAGVGWWLLAGFVAVAAGGFYLFSRQVKGEPWPGFVIVAHGGLAVVMIVLLGVWIAGTPATEGTSGPPIDAGAPEEVITAE